MLKTLNLYIINSHVKRNKTQVAMATIKSYSDLQQSKKLAEILPLESADMYYEEVCNLPKVIVGNYTFHNQCMEDKDYKKLSNPVLSPAWSLAALLDILSRSAYFSNEAGIIELSSMKAIIWRVSILNCGKIEDCYSENSIDACVNMIIKLHEQNLL